MISRKLPVVFLAKDFGGYSMTKVNPDFIINFYLRHIRVVSTCKEKWEKIIPGKPKLK